MTGEHSARVLFDMLASDAASGTILLHALTQHAVQGAPQHNRASSLRVALAGNHTLDDEDTLALLTCEPGLLRHVATRPGMGSPTLIQWATVCANMPTLLKEALAVADDPDGHFARHAVQQGSARIYQALLHRPNTPNDIQLTAALHLAERRTHTQRDVRDILDVAARHPDHHQQFTTAAGSSDLRTALQDAPHLAGSSDEAGTPAWYATTATPQVLTWLARQPEQVWRTALSAHRDPTGALAAAAVAAHPSRGIVSAVWGACPRPDIHLAGAASLLQQDIPLSAAVRQGVIPLLRTAPLDAIPPIFFRRLSVPWFWALAQRTDLNADHLERLHEASSGLFGNDYYRFRFRGGVAAHLATFGAILALHPNATPAQRRIGSTLAHDLCNTTLSVPAALAQAAQRRQNVADLAVTFDGEPVRIGRALPMAALRCTDHAAAYVTHLTACVQAAARHTPLRTVDAVAAFCALAPTFAGTVGDLLDVATAVHT